MQGDGEINALFSGIKGAQTPLVGLNIPALKYVAGAFHKLRRARQEEYKSQCAGCPLSGKVREISFFQGQGKVRKFSHATIFIVPTQPIVTSL